MISREYGVLRLTCDLCNEESMGFCDYDDVKNFEKEYGWKYSRDNGMDLCPGCQKLLSRPLDPFAGTGKTVIVERRESE